MTTIIILAMHGSPPKDFPKHELMEYFGLHSRLEQMAGVQLEDIADRYRSLDTKVCSWPRNEDNDPFFFASHELAKQLRQTTGNDVIVGFNEFCNPSVEEALNEAIAKGATKIIVVTPMMTPGGEHAQVDIPAAIERVKAQSPGIEIHYAWPFELLDVARFLSEQIKKTSR